MVQSEGNVSLKNPVTPPGIDPRTFRLVAQRLIKVYLGITQPIIEKDVNDRLEVEISNKYQNLNKIRILENNIFYCACLDLDKIISKF